MGRSRPQPLFRSRLYPLVEPWTAGPGITTSVLRFVLPASAAVASPQAEQSLRGCSALLAPEFPFSVLPNSLREAVEVGSLEADEHWRGRPVPPWRGVPCRFGTLRLFLPNEIDPEQPASFPVLVLVAERDPPGPRPPHVLLGAEFLRHYTLRVVLDYSAIRYVAQGQSGRSSVDVSVPCGYLEKR